MRPFDEFIAASKACSEATANFLAVSRAMGAEPSAKERNDFIEANRICRETQEEFRAACERYREELAAT